MGGPGSGNHRHYGAKSTTDDYRALDVRRLAREGMLQPGRSGIWNWMRRVETIASISFRADRGQITLEYRHRSNREEWVNEKYPVRIESTRCHLGGSRPWFICPVAGCGRRVAILYGGGIFACRHCHRLAYASSREDAGDRAARKAGRIRKQLGWRRGILNEPGEKPKWMRWKTFIQLVSEHDELVAECLQATALELGILERALRTRPS